MRFLIIAQDLHVSGTSEGIVSRSFIGKLRKVYPEAIIDVLYLSTSDQEDNLEILPVNYIVKKVISRKIPFHVKWINRITRRFFNYLFSDNYIHNQFANHIKKIDHTLYDHIMVRSAGLDHETLLAMHKLPILKHTIVNFHDPYPYPWYKGDASKIDSNQLKRLNKIIEIVSDAKACSASAYYMSKDLQYLYTSDKYFYTLPHQFSFEVFDFSDKSKMRKKERKVQISYHGALMFGRNVFTIVEAFKQLMEEHEWIKKDVEFILRVKGDGVKKLKEVTNKFENIIVLDTLNFSNSSNEQIHESDINIILENGPYYCNILGGKAPFLFSLDKKIFISSPERSELKRYLPNYPFISNMNDLADTKLKLYEVLTSENTHNSETKELFSDESFKKSLDMILFNKMMILHD